LAQDEGRVDARESGGKERKGYEERGREEEMKG